MGATTDIVQDNYGFIWVAGENGVLRFDGVNIKHYSHNPIKVSLSSNFTRNILVDHGGTIWVGTDYGLCHLDTLIDNFRCFVHTPNNTNGLSGNTVYALDIGEDNSLYIGTENGLTILSPDRKTFTNLFNRKPNSPLHPLNSIASLYVDGNKLWVGTVDNGYGIYHLDDQKVEFFPYVKNSKTSVSYPHIRHFLKDNKGRMWISTYGGGLNLIQPNQKQIKRYRYSPANPNSLGSDVLWRGFQDSEGTIWFATDHGGLARYNEETDDFTNFQHTPNNETSISSNQVRTIYEDNNGNLWIGTFPQGINFINRSAQFIEHWTLEPNDKNSLTHSSILSFYEDSKKHIWIGTEAGLNEYNPFNNRFKHYLPKRGQQGALQAGPILALTEDPSGNIWVGTWSGGLHKLDRKRGQFKNFPINPNNPEAAQDDFIWKLEWDKKLNKLFLATESHGLALFNPEEETFKYFRHAPLKRKTISSDFVINLLHDSENQLWVLTDKGLDLFNSSTQSFTRYTSYLYELIKDDIQASSIRFRSFAMDHYGRLWLGSQNTGLFLFDPKTLFAKRITMNDGLPADFISSIVVDKFNQIWATTPNGVVRIPADDPQKMTIFTQYDGLVSNHYNRNATLVDSSGMVYLGSIDGVSRFYPDQISNTLRYSQVHIQNLQILNRSITPATVDSPIDKPILETKNLSLNYDDSMITFEYIAMNFAAPNSFEYAYKLEGFDQDWNYVGNKRFATYTNLNHGNYLFKVKARPENGIWPDQATELSLTVLPPPWLSYWAYIIYAAGIITLIVFIVRFQYKRLELKAEKSLNSELIRLNRIKDSFLANTSHELRTPLNGIIGMAESVCEEAKNQLNMDLINRLHFISKSGKRLSNLINDILDYSKLGKNKLAIYPQAINLHDTTETAFTLLAPLANEKKLHLINDVKKDLPLVYADENRLQQVLLNLIGNGIKYSERGFVKVLANIEDGKVKVRVSDTGVGIPETDIKEIFDAFHQVEEQTRHRKGGTGLGLAVTKELVELQGGSIWVHSREKVGSTFIFTLPIFKQDQKINEPLAVTAKTEKPETEAKTKSKYIDHKKFVSHEPPEHEDKVDLSQAPEYANETVIMIVDDDPINRMVLRAMLQLHQYQIIEAVDGLDALNKIQTTPVDLIILDIMMPKMSGFEVCERVRTLFPIHKLPILFLTAEKIDEDVHRGFAVGGNEFLTKPISKFEILPRVANHVRLLHVYRKLEQDIAPS